MGDQRHPPGAALGRRGLLGPSQAGERLVPGPVGASRGADRAQARAGAGVQPVAHLQDHRLRRRHRMGVRGREPRAGRQHPVGGHQQPQPQRDRESGLLAGRVGRGSVPVRSAGRAVLLREAPVLPRRDRAVHHAQLADLHPPHRAAGGGGQAHRQGVRHRHRAAVRGGRSGGLALQGRPSHLQPAPPPARRRRAVARGPGLHRSHGRERLQPGAGRRRPAALRRGLQSPAPAGWKPHAHLGRHHDGAALVRPLRAERPHLRLPRDGQRERPRLPGPERLLPAAGAVARQLRPAGHGLRAARQLGGERDGRRQPGRAVPVRPVRDQRGDAGREDALERQRAAARRVDRRCVGADRGVRLPVRGVRRLPDPARRGHGAVRRPAEDPQPGLRAAGADAGVRPVLGERVPAVGARRELPRVGLGRDNAVQCGPRLAPDGPAAPERQLPAAAGWPAHRRQHGQHPAHSATQGGVPAVAADLPAAGGRVRQRAAGRPARSHPHRGAAAHLRFRGGRLRPRHGVRPPLVPGRPAVLVPAESGDGAVRRLREHAA